MKHWYKHNDKCYFIHRSIALTHFTNKEGIIMNDDSTFHKNKLPNLMTLCEKCHDELHKTDEQHKRVKTSKGIVVKKK